MSPCVNGEQKQAHLPNPSDVGARSFTNFGQVCHPIDYSRRVGPHEVKPRLDTLPQRGQQRRCRSHLPRSEAIAKPGSRIAYMLDRVPCGVTTTLRSPRSRRIEIPRFSARHKIEYIWEAKGRREVPNV